MKDPLQNLLALRAQIELSTGVVLRAVQRNAFIGKPITQTERELRADRDRRVHKEMGKARAALTEFEAACKQIGQE